MSGEEMVRVGGVDLCVETFGDQGAALILLISGAATSMDWWDTAFCRRLAEGDRFVVRYDHRDTGRSTHWPPGAPGYTADDLVADAVGLVDACAGGRAHLVGLSMGGGMAQRIAVDHPDRVATLTLISTSPAFPVGAGGQLPPMADRLRAALSSPPPDPDWSDRDAVVEHLVRACRPFAGPESFDEVYVRQLARRAVARTVDNEASAKNHWLVVGGGDGEETAPRRMADVSAPTLVVHGTEDPLFPPEHGSALARGIPVAELLLLPGAGHQQPPPHSTWDLVVPAILRHTALHGA